MGKGFSNLIHSRRMLRRIDRMATTMTALEEPHDVETQKLPEVEATHH